MVLIDDIKDIFYPLTQRGDLCALQNNAQLNKNVSNNRQQTWPVRCRDFQHGQVVDQVVADTDFRLHIELLKQSRCTAVGAGLKLALVSDLLQQGFANPFQFSGVISNGVALAVQYYKCVEGDAAAG